MVCVPVAGPWVVVPSSTSVPRQRVEFQLTCPRGHVVGGLDARLSVRAIDVGFIGTLGSPVNPGITTSRSAVFLGTYVGRSAARADLPPVHRLHAGGGRRLARSHFGLAASPGRPVTRRVKSVRVRPGTTTVVQRCSSGERSWRVARVRLLDADAAEREPRRLASPARRRSEARASSFACAAMRSSPACARSSRCMRSCRGPSAMSFQSPWMLLGLLVIAAFVGIWLWAERRRARYAVRYTNLDVLATVVSAARGCVSCPRRFSCSVSARSSSVWPVRTSSARSCERRRP